MDYENVRALFVYAPETGIVTNRLPRHCAKAGSRSGYQDRDGYRKIRFRGRTFLEHRLIFLWMTGRWPTNEIDHINRDPSDNRWVNLREATRSQNCANTRPKKNKIKGVYWHKDRRKWQASIRDGRRLRYLGLFETEEAAQTAYRVAGEKIYGEFFSEA